MSALNNLIKEFEHPRAFEMKFMELYNKTLLTCKEEQPYPTDFTRPSSLGKCARNIFFERTHAPKDPIDLNNPWIYNSVGILESGTDRHERIQNVLFKMEEQGFIKNIDIPTAIKDAQAEGIKSEFVKWNEDKTEARCCNTEYNLYFQADGLVELDNKKAVFEIKTVSCKKLASIRKSQKPLPPHILQATAYAMCLGVDYILFFYEDRDFTSHFPILYKVTDEDKRVVTEKLALVDKCCREGVIPPPNKLECMFCTYKELCNSIENEVAPEGEL